MQYIESQLVDSGDSNLVVYKSGSHQGYRTYDGVDVNGKRVADEIIEQSSLVRPTRFSIVGYSLGGLIARYAIGVLYSQGYFDTILPINFVTFCSPHVGILSPLRNSMLARLFNGVAPYFLAHSGSQMFMTDGSHGKVPLLVWMANPRSVFYQGLASFRYRSLYANAVNDKRTCWFTSYITDHDPFNSILNDRPDAIVAHRIPEYAPCIIDMRRNIALETGIVQNRHDGQIFFIRIILWMRLVLNLFVYTPLLVFCFILITIVQRARANRRVRDFLKKSSNRFSYFSDEADSLKAESAHDRKSKSKSMIDELQRDICNQISMQQEDLVDSVYGAMGSFDDAADSSSLLSPQQSHSSLSTERLDLNDDQMFVVKNLNKLYWSKHGVLISDTKTPHAAIIVRHPDPNFEEGKTVIRHFMEQTFQSF